MSDLFALELLRAQVVSDTAIYKAEKERFNRLLHSNAEEITEIDRKAIINWSRTSITDYSRQLEKMEGVERPSQEEKHVMRLLNELVMLGDQIAEFITHFVKQYEEKFGKSKMKPETDGKIFQKKRSVPCAPNGKADRKTSQPPTITITPPPADTPALPSGVATEERRLSQGCTPEAAAESAGARILTADREDVDDGEDIDIDAEGEVENRQDPEGIYAALGVSPTATMPEIRKAYRDMLKQLHPDRNRDVEDAASRFADFKALYSETLGDEEKRAAYDNIQTADESEQLTRRVKQLATR